MNVFVGVDGGGTKTEVTLVDRLGAVVSHARGDSSAYKSVGADQATATIVDLIARVMPSPEQVVTRLVASLSDIDTRADIETVQRSLRFALHRRSLSIERVEITNDSVAALVAGTGGVDRGVVCIAGTGSVVLGIDGPGREARAGGWGPPFGDGGGAYWIGFQALATCLHLFDRGRTGAPLLRALLAASGASSLGDLLFGYAGASDEAENAAVYRARVAGLAVAVEACARSGDGESRRVFRRAGRELALLVRHVVRRLRPMRRDLPLVLAGSVWRNEIAEFHRSFRTGIARDLPGVAPLKTDRTPAHGAALLAWRLGVSADSAPTGVVD